MHFLLAFALEAFFTHLLFVLGGLVQAFLPCVRFAFTQLLRAFMLLTFPAHLRRAHAFSLHALLPRTLLALVLVPHALVALAFLSSHLLALAHFPPGAVMVILILRGRGDARGQRQA